MSLWQDADFGVHVGGVEVIGGSAVVNGESNGIDFVDGDASDKRR